MHVVTSARTGKVWELRLPFGVLGLSLRWEALLHECTVVRLMGSYHGNQNFRLFIYEEICNWQVNQASPLGGTPLLGLEWEPIDRGLLAMRQHTQQLPLPSHASLVRRETGNGFSPGLSPWGSRVFLCCRREQT